MPTILQLRRGTTTEHASFTGAEGEVTVNTTKDTLVVHDGSTAGGFELALADGSNVSVSTEQVQDAAASMFTTATHTNITATYDDAAGTLSLATTAHYTDSDARAAVSASGDLGYNSSTGVFSFTERTDAEVRGLVSGSTGIDYNSTTGEFSVDSTIATKTYADGAATTAVAAVIDSAPGALDTLNELAAALGDDANFSTTVTNSIATKLNSSAVSAYGLTLIDDADAATARTTLGLGTAATTASTDYATAAQGATADSAVQNLGDLGITSTAAEINTLDGFTGVVADLNYAKDLRATGVTSTEFDYLDGVTSNIQTQLNGKATSAQGALADSAVQNLADLSITATAAEINKLDGVTATTAELNYIDGVTSNIQTQLNAKLASSSYTAADILTKIKTVDGAGSGLDADLLDGQSSAYYRIGIYNSAGTLLN